MSRWQVEVTSKAEKELSELADDLYARFLYVSEMLQDFGPQRVGRPHVRQLRGKLWEMRLKGKDGIARAIYFATRGRRLIVVRAFVKKTEKTPKREIDLAEERMKEF